MHACCAAPDQLAPNTRTREKRVAPPILLPPAGSPPLPSHLQLEFSALATYGHFSVDEELLIDVGLESPGGGSNP